MPVYDRWFLLPVETVTENGEEVTRPKYSDDDRISGYSGNTIDPSTVDAHYAALIQQHSDVEQWYIVRFYGEDTEGWNALNEIHNEMDTRTLADHANDVAPVMNDHFPDLDKSGEEWANSFWVNV